MREMEFIEMAKQEIMNQLPENIREGLHLEEANIVKMNDQQLHGISFQREEGKAAPTFYLDDAYERFQSGESLKNLMSELTEAYLSQDTVSMTPPEPQLDFDSIKDHLTLRLVETKRNRMYLNNTPYMSVGNGLAMVCDIQIGEDQGGFWRTTVTKDMLEKNGYDKKALFTQAMDSVWKNDPPVLMNMETRLFSFGEPANLMEQKEPLDKEDVGNMYVLSNASGILGSAALFYPGAQEHIAEVLGEGYSVLPSSVHEVIIVPDSADMDPMHLGEMVREANRSVVEPKDVLSDNVYHFDKDERRLSTQTHNLELVSRVSEGRY